MEKQKKLINVLVPAFNQEKYIGRCLRSLISQSLDKNSYEIIVVDDGSTDNTSYALSLFTDPYNNLIKVITNKKNQGLPYSLNKAIRSSDSEYIVRVDSDDYVNSDFLKILYLYLKFNLDSKAICCDYFTVDDEENIISRHNSKDSPIACGLMYRRDILEEIGLYNEKFLWNEDKEFRKRLELKYNVDHINLPLYRYRRHDKNMTNNIEKMNFYEKLI